jgi:hypothetical protein
MELIDLPFHGSVDFTRQNHSIFNLDIAILREQTSNCSSVGGAMDS